MTKRSVLVSICVLFAVLSIVTVLFTRQDTQLRVVLSGRTIVRNGQRLDVSVHSGNGDVHIIQAQTPHYSIYEYNAPISAKVWKDAEFLRAELGGLRRGDEIYIETVAVKRPFSGWVYIDNDVFGDCLYDVCSAEIAPTGGLLSLIVTATRAQTADLSIEGPSFSIPADVLKTGSDISTAYMLSILSIIAVWSVAVFAVPRRMYFAVPGILRRLTDAVKGFSAIDYVIIAFGITSLVFYHFGNRVSFDNANNAHYILSGITVLLLFLKWLAVPRSAGANGEPGQISGNTVMPRRRWVPYIAILALSLLVYVPALFPSPYYWNDEFFGIDAAKWYLNNGNFDFYNRAWPHTWLIAQAIRFFGDSTVSTRAISALCGVIFAVSAYHIIRKMTRQNKTAALSALLLLCNPFLVSIFVMVRMYALLMPVSLWLFYFIYKTLHCEIVYKRDNTVTRFLSRYFNFHFGYAAAVFLLMWLTYNIHINAMIIPLCAVIYVFFTAALKRERKFISLSIVAIAIFALITALYMLRDRLPFDLPVIPALIGNLENFSGFGWYNYVYFWNNINVPLGPFFGISFLLTAFAMLLVYIPKALRNFPDNVACCNGTPCSAIAYPAVTYILTVTFFVFFADRYYEYVYMSFLTPVTIMLVAAGVCIFTAKLTASTRQAVFIVVIAAAVLQMSAYCSWLYIDRPERTKFNRPYQMMLNDAKAEELETVYLYATAYRSYFNSVVKGIEREVIGSVRSRPNQIDFLVEWADDFEQATAYFFSEYEKFYYTSAVFAHFLETAVEPVTFIDSSVVYKFRFVEASFVPAGSVITEDDAALHISDVFWDGDVAYLQCMAEYTPALEGAKFIAVEVIEQGLTQSAAHKYQVLIPEGIGDAGDAGDAGVLMFTLQLRPKTEEYVENITFDIAQRVYVYYGKDAYTIIDIN